MFAGHEYNHIGGIQNSSKCFSKWLTSYIYLLSRQRQHDSSISSIFAYAFERCLSVEWNQILKIISKIIMNILLFYGKYIKNKKVVNRYIKKITCYVPIYE